MQITSSDIFYTITTYMPIRDITAMICCSTIQHELYVTDVLWKMLLDRDHGIINIDKELMLDVIQLNNELKYDHGLMLPAEKDYYELLYCLCKTLYAKK